MASWAGPGPWGLQGWDTGPRLRRRAVEESQKETLEETQEETLEESQEETLEESQEETL